MDADHNAIRAITITILGFIFTAGGTLKRPEPSVKGHKMDRKLVDGIESIESESMGLAHHRVLSLEGS